MSSSLVSGPEPASPALPAELLQGRVLGRVREQQGAELLSPVPSQACCVHPRQCCVHPSPAVSIPGCSVSIPGCSVSIPALLCPSQAVLCPSQPCCVHPRLFCVHPRLCCVHPRLCCVHPSSAVSIPGCAVSIPALLCPSQPCCVHPSPAVSIPGCSVSIPGSAVSIPGCSVSIPALLCPSQAVLCPSQAVLCPSHAVLCPSQPCCVHPRQCCVHPSPAVSIPALLCPSQPCSVHPSPAVSIPALLCPSQPCCVHPSPAVSIPGSAVSIPALLCPSQAVLCPSQPCCVHPSPAVSLQDDDTCEEWQRHAALHEDVTQQERLRERLFEEEIELKWEKGGSGLVFYTDAQFWQEQEGDFDEQTADDWDVDMSIYYDKDGGDKDARDSVQMWLERRLRDGLEDGSVSGQPIGSFERHTKVSSACPGGAGPRWCPRALGQEERELLAWEEGSGRLRVGCVQQVCDGSFPSRRALAGRSWSSRAGQRGWAWGAATPGWPKLWTTRVRTPGARGGWGTTGRSCQLLSGGRSPVLTLLLSSPPSTMTLSPRTWVTSCSGASPPRP
uniref:G-patch domain containing 3 n=1 Tax=Taeniopygia guttata TaxID=59729 RepID=A0A674GA47_TAEGU